MEDQRDEKLHAICDELVKMSYDLRDEYSNYLTQANKNHPSKERNYLALMVNVDGRGALAIRWTRYISVYRQGLKKTAMPTSIKRGQKGTGFSSRILSKHAAPWAVDIILETENRANQIRQLYKRVRKIQSQLRLLDVHMENIIWDIDEFKLALAAAD